MSACWDRGGKFHIRMRKLYFFDLELIMKQKKKSAAIILLEHVWEEVSGQMAAEFISSGKTQL
jgi:hypothetical protein